MSMSVSKDTVIDTAQTAAGIAVSRWLTYQVWHCYQSGAVLSLALVTIVNIGSMLFTYQRFVRGIFIPVCNRLKLTPPDKDEG